MSVLGVSDVLRAVELFLSTSGFMHCNYISSIEERFMPIIYCCRKIVMNLPTFHPVDRVSM